jgi:hypothetical protein
MSEKQTTFFTINCAEKFESPNQCLTNNKAHDPSTMQDLYENNACSPDEQV